MKGLNRKGLTLIELIVSISLMSLVMLFLYRLLANISYDSDNDFFAASNQEQRIEIIDYIQTIIRKSAVTSVSTNKAGNFSITIGQSGASKNYTIIVYKDSIQIKDSSTVLRVWDLEKGVYSPTNSSCTRASTIEGSSDTYHPWVCKIPVYTVNSDNNANNNNTLDDITFSFLALN